jgi:hypothetical protein
MVYDHFVVMDLVMNFVMKVQMMKKLMHDKQLIFVINVQVNDLEFHLQAYSMNLEKNSDSSFFLFFKNTKEAASQEIDKKNMRCK